MRSTHTRHLVHEPTLALTDQQAREVDAVMAGRIERKDPTALHRSTHLAVAKVFIYLDFYTWLNLNTKPAETAGQGIIPARLANEIAKGENTSLQRLITDPDDGQIISVGRRSYRPPATLARLANALDRECRSPVCHRPAQVCELDHVEDWQAKNGETAHDNLASFCTKDHHLKGLPG